MADVMDAFKHLDVMNQLQLMEQRSKLVSQAPEGDWRKLPDEILQELVAIHRILRRSAGPKTTTRNIKSEIPTPDQL